MKKIILTDEQKKFIEENYKLPNTQLSKILGINAKIIGKYKTEKGISSKQILEEKKKYIIEHIDLSAKELAEILDMDRHTVGRIKKELGVNFTQLHNFHEYDQYIIDSYEIKTSAELANEIGCSKGYIAKIWSQAGLSGKGTFRYHVNNDYFSEITTDNQAYLLGFIASDGCVYKREGHQGLLSIGLSIKDKQIINDIQKELKSTHVCQENDTTITLAITSDKIFNDLSSLGIHPRKTWTIDLNEICSHIPKQYIKDFIRGYFDGDGSISSSDQFATIAGHSIKIAIPEQSGLQLVDIMKKYYIDATFQKDYREGHYSQSFGSIEFTSTTKKYCFLKWIYSDITEDSLKLNRKYEKARTLLSRIENNDTNRIENIQAVQYWNKISKELI